MFLVLKVIAVEPLAGISLSYDKNTCDRLSTCQNNGPRISDPTDRDDTQINLLNINGI